MVEISEEKGEKQILISHESEVRLVYPKYSTYCILLMYDKLRKEVTLEYSCLNISWYIGGSRL